MSFLKRAIKQGISDGIGKAVGEAITTAIEPKATELANKAAARIEQEVEKREVAEAAEQAAKEARVKSVFGGLESAFADLEKAATSYATEMSKNYKICPNCGKPSDVDKKFCPACGTKLPEETLAAGAVCPACGKQNDIGTKFCADCGTKLPAAVQEEEAAKAKDDAVMVKWDTLLANYPKWTCGGKDYDIEQYDIDQFRFVAQFEGNSIAAQNAVKQYRILLQENGFTTAGQYPNVEHLYKMVDNTCYHVNTEHCFDGDPDCPNIYFSVGEPTGGFYYVKEEPKKQQLDLDDLKEGLGALKGLFKK